MGKAVAMAQTEQGMALRIGTVVLLGLLLPSCASPPAKLPDAGEDLHTEQRLADLERRVQRLEGRPVVEMPHQDREDVHAHIASLEAERARLLVKYTDQHPAVRDIERKLLILKEQLRKLEP
jgi:uncharacterized protein YceH (UPF0502 family)